MKDTKIFWKFWKKGFALLLLCFGMSVMGCQCLVIIPPVEFQKPEKKILQKKTPTKEPLQECDLEAKPDKIEFELTSVGKVAHQLVKVTNIGDRACSISNIRVIGLLPKNNKAFIQDSTYQLPFLLMEGRTIDIKVSFRPLAQSTTYKGVLLIDNNSPLHPRLRVELEGSSTGPCLKITPPKLAMGATQRGCQSRSKYATLALENKKHCPSSIQVTDARLTSDTSSEFSLNSAVKFPYTLQRGKSVKIGVFYKAKDLGLDKGILRILTDHYKKPFEIPVEGQGVPDALQTDTFAQKERSIVDILFVIDSSCSMGDNQDSMADNFNSFIRWAIRLKADYHIGVTTTDVTGRQFAAGCLQGVTTTIITPKTSNPVVAFGQNVRVGTRGSSTERGLEAGYQALLLHSQKGCNQGFYRKSAMLSLIFVSDEPDQSARTVDFYLSFFRSLKGSASSSLLRASAIVGPERVGCRGNGSAGPGPRYLKVARSLGGETASICSSNWSSTLNKLGITSFGRQSKFTLSRPALPSSIIVKVNGKIVPRHLTNGWSFDAQINAVLFAKTFIPDVGSVVRIQYQVACLP